MGHLARCQDPEVSGSLDPALHPSAKDHQPDRKSVLASFQVVVSAEREERSLNLLAFDEFSPSRILQTDLAHFCSSNSISSWRLM